MRAIRSSAARTLASAGRGWPTAVDDAAAASAATTIRSRMTIPSCCQWSARREQRVERALAGADFLESRIAQAAVPIELDGAVHIPVVDQQIWRGSLAGGRLDR